MIDKCCFDMSCGYMGTCDITWPWWVQIIILLLFLLILKFVLDHSNQLKDYNI